MVEKGNTFKFLVDSYTLDTENWAKEFKLEPGKTLTIPFHGDYGTFKYGFDAAFDWKSFIPGLTPKPTYTVVPEGVYTPQELGLDFPKCTSVSIGICTKYDKEKRNWTYFGVKWTWERVYNWMLTEMAHAHDTRMCIKDGRYVFESKGKPDEVAVHEYAHILAGDGHGHDAIWQEKAKSLGIQARLMINYNYTGDPISPWKTKKPPFGGLIAKVGLTTHKPTQA